MKSDLNRALDRNRAERSRGALTHGLHQLNVDPSKFQILNFDIAYDLNMEARMFLNAPSTVSIGGEEISSADEVSKTLEGKRVHPNVCLVSFDSYDALGILAIANTSYALSVWETLLAVDTEGFAMHSVNMDWWTAIWFADAQRNSYMFAWNYVNSPPNR